MASARSQGKTRPPLPLLLPSLLFFFRKEQLKEKLEQLPNLSPPSRLLLRPGSPGIP